MSRIKFIYCKPCILSPLEDFCASNKGQRQTYKSVSRFLCALHKEHRQIPQTRDTSLLPCRCACSIQSCPILFDSMGCSPPSSSVHGILQARIPEWVAMPSSKGSSQSRDQTQLSCIAGRFFTTEHPLPWEKQKWSNPVISVFMEQLIYGQECGERQSFQVQFTEDLDLGQSCCDHKSISDPALNFKIQISFSFKDHLNYGVFITYSKPGASVKSPIKEGDFIPTQPQEK